ncbi:MAG TPA: hypothetical protein VFV93_09690 [Thermomicrobiales bacterium]|nr:hypothetical protein [Thermomicrobiales bacterium]
MLLWIALILSVAALLTITIERLIARLGIRREDPTPSGLAMLAQRLEQWSSKRRKK